MGEVQGGAPPAEPPHAAHVDASSANAALDAGMAAVTSPTRECVSSHTAVTHHKGPALLVTVEAAAPAGARGCRGHLPGRLLSSLLRVPWRHLKDTA